MCRWIAYSGGAIPLNELLFEPENSLIDQSLSSQMADEPTNADGFGIGWYGRRGEPGVFRSVLPAWNDTNLSDLAFHVESPLFLAHVRRSTGAAVQQSNCHPFRHGRWLFVHNGEIQEHRRIRRDLLLALAPELVPDLGGSTDSELLFLLALTFGLDEGPLPALEKTVGLVERLGRERGIEHPVQMTLGLTDGERLFAVRYSSEGRSRTLFHSESKQVAQELYPSHPRLDVFPADARAIVSEPLNELQHLWVEVPEATALVVRAGEVQSLPFEPRLP